MLVISDFSKNYGDELILSVKSLSLDAGIHLIKGDNGSGKTSLFKSVAGIVPSSGEISIDKVSLREHPVAYRYAVNLAEAEPVYPGFLTAKDLMRFIAKTKNASAMQLAYYRKHLGIDWFYDKPCGTYSSGMLKKLSLALAFLGEPKLIILDEPLITLDETTRTNLYRLMKEKEKTIFLLSSHHEIETRLLEISGTWRIRNKTLVFD